MGKTARGAVWLDASLMTPFDFYQFWYNVDDRDVGKLLRLYTFLPLERIAELEQLEGADLREAKKVLAFEVTQLVHGEEAARAATSRSNMPEHTIQWSDLEDGIRVYVVLCDAQMTASRGEARRLLKVERSGLVILASRTPSRISSPSTCPRAASWCASARSGHCG